MEHILKLYHEILYTKQLIDSQADPIPQLIASYYLKVELFRFYTSKKIPLDKTYAIRLQKMKLSVNNLYKSKQFQNLKLTSKIIRTIIPELKKQLNEFKNGFHLYEHEGLEFIINTLIDQTKNNQIKAQLDTIKKDLQSYPHSTSKEYLKQSKIRLAKLIETMDDAFQKFNHDLKDGYNPDKTFNKYYKIFNKHFEYLQRCISITLKKDKNSKLYTFLFLLLNDFINLNRVLAKEYRIVTPFKNFFSVNSQNFSGVSYDDFIIWRFVTRLYLACDETNEAKAGGAITAKQKKESQKKQLLKDLSEKYYSDIIFALKETRLYEYERAELEKLITEHCKIFSYKAPKDFDQYIRQFSPTPHSKQSEFRQYFQTYVPVLTLKERLKYIDNTHHYDQAFLHASQNFVNGLIFVEKFLKKEEFSNFSKQFIDYRNSLTKIRQHIRAVLESSAGGDLTHLKIIAKKLTALNAVFSSLKKEQLDKVDDVQEYIKLFNQWKSLSIHTNNFNKFESLSNEIEDIKASNTHSYTISRNMWTLLLETVDLEVAFYHYQHYKALSISLDQIIRTLSDQYPDIFSKEDVLTLSLATVQEKYNIIQEILSQAYEHDLITHDKTQKIITTYFTHDKAGTKSISAEYSSPFKIYKNVESFEIVSLKNKKRADESSDQNMAKHSGSDGGTQNFLNIAEGDQIDLQEHDVIKPLPITPEERLKRFNENLWKQVNKIRKEKQQKMLNRESDQRVFIQASISVIPQQNLPLLQAYSSIQNSQTLGTVIQFPVQQTGLKTGTGYTVSGSGPRPFMPSTGKGNANIIPLNSARPQFHLPRGYGLVQSGAPMIGGMYLSHIVAYMATKDPKFSKNASELSLFLIVPAIIWYSCNTAGVKGGIWASTKAVTNMTISRFSSAATGKIVSAGFLAVAPIAIIHQIHKKRDDMRRYYDKFGSHPQLTQSINQAEQMTLSTRYGSPILPLDENGTLDKSMPFVNHEFAKLELTYIEANLSIISWYEEMYKLYQKGTAEDKKYFNKKIYNAMQAKKKDILKRQSSVETIYNSTKAAANQVKLSIQKSEHIEPTSPLQFGTFDSWLDKKPAYSLHK